VQELSAGAVKGKYMISKTEYDLWLVVTKRKNGGFCWLLTRSLETATVSEVKEAFHAYGQRCKTEKFHRHVKPSYKLEDIQIRTFDRMKSMLAVLTVAMSIIYRTIEPLHQKLILEGGIKTSNKEKRYNF